MLFNDKSEPKVCKLAHFKKSIYQRFLAEIVEKELEVSSSLQNRSDGKVRTLALSTKISVNDLKIKMKKFVSSINKNTQSVVVKVSIRPDSLDAARGLLDRCIMMLESIAKTDGEPDIVDDNSKLFSETDFVKEFEEGQNKYQATPQVFFLKQSFLSNQYEEKETDEPEEKKSFDDVELSEKDLFNVVDELWMKKGAVKTATEFQFDESRFDEDEVEEKVVLSSQEAAINLPWVVALATGKKNSYLGGSKGVALDRRRSKVKNNNPILYTEVLEDEPELKEFMIKELKKSNKELTEANVEAWIKKSMNKKYKYEEKE